MDRKTSILLGLNDFKVLGQKIINDQEIEPEVIQRYTIAMCPECKNWTRKIHEQKEERRVRDCSVFGKRSYLVFKTRRFQCENKDCQKVFVERLKDIE
jgi:transposase